MHRIDRGEQTTACAEACAKAGHGAIVFGDLNDPASEISRRVREIRDARSCAPTCGSTPACATRGCEDDARHAASMPRRDARLLAAGRARRRWSRRSAWARRTTWRCTATSSPA
ncbi:MAG: hypothetical protein MZV65_33100 [Chromatiales bacterium]|nr:hypothetical protein [Chromatiales bacterium]